MADSEQPYTKNFVSKAPAQNFSLQRNLEPQEKPAQYPVNTTCSKHYFFTRENYSPLCVEAAES